MKAQLKKILNHTLFFPVLILYYGVFYILFGEKYPLTDGMSTDGYVYASFIPNFTKSFFFDVFYVHRIFPSFLVTIFFKIFYIQPTNSNIVIAFQCLNLISIMLSCYFLKKIFVLFNISLKNQILAFLLFLINFALLKWPFYLPVMTDSVALLLSTMLLYYYLKNNIIGLVITTFLISFTWPMGYYQGLLLIAFPFRLLPFSPLLKMHKVILHTGSVLYILLISIYLIFVNEIDVIELFAAKIDRNLLPLSLLGVIVLYFFFTKMFFNKYVINKSFFIENMNFKRILISLILYVFISILVFYLHPNPNQIFPTSRILSDVIIYSLVRPLITIVAHTSYFGVIVLLLIIFWSSLCKTISKMGWGLLFAFGLNIFSFGIGPETRHLINLLPWLIVFLIITLNNYYFSNSFYVVVGLFNITASKIWLLLNRFNGDYSLKLDKNGCMDFPRQFFWMNNGTYMSEQMYYLQGAIMIFFLAILFFLLYKIKINSENKIEFERKY